jgi:WD40 repeat protein
MFNQKRENALLNFYCISDASGMVKFWHFTTGKCLHTIHDGETSQILTLSVNPDNTMFCTTGDNPQIHLYDMETLKRVNTLEPRYIII